MIHCSHKLKKKLWKSFLLSVTVFLQDTDWILGWTRNSRWNLHQTSTELLTPKFVTTYTHLLMPNILKEKLIVEFALMHKFGIITVHPFSMYASPIFAQRKPNEKLRILVDVRKVNTLISKVSTNVVHPIRTLTDEAQHLAGRSFLRFQAHHSLQVLDQNSIEKLSFNFATSTFAYRRLAHALSRSVLVFPSFMSQYLDPVVKDDKRAQYVYDIEIEAKNVTNFTRNIRAFIKCIHKAGLKLSIEKCHFRVGQVPFLGRTISLEQTSSQAGKIQNIPGKRRFPKSKRPLQRGLGFVNYYINFVPRIAKKLNPLYKLLKAEVPFNSTPEMKETFDSVNKALSEALKQPISRKRPVLMTDASFRRAGFILMIEDNPNQKIQSKRIT